MSSITDLIATHIDSLQPDLTREKNAIKKLIPDYLLDIADDYDIVIAGGMVTSVFSSSIVNDIDVYILNKSHQFPLIVDLLANSTIVSATSKSMLVNHSGTLINVIYFKTFKDAYDVFKSFDFSVVMGAYDIKKDEFILHKNFLKDLAKRELVFNEGTDFPIVSAIRTKKYESRGYHICKKDYVAVILKCMQLTITSYEELEDQIGGMYGLDLSLFTDITLPFDFNRVVSDILSSDKDIDSSEALRISDNHSNKKKKILAVLLKDVKKHLYEYQGGLFINNGGRLLQMNDSTFSKGDIPETLPKLTGVIKLYKFVKSTSEEGVFESFWNKEFKYAIGKEVTSDGKGMWGGCLNNTSNFSNNNNPSRVLIELDVNVDDILSVGRYDMTFKRAVVIKAMDGKYGTNEGELSLSDVVNLDDNDWANI